MAKDIPANPSSADDIADRIFTVRGRRVLLDSDLASMYGATTKQFNQAVRRNIDRFPADFCFPLRDQDLAVLRSQIVTSSSRHGGRRYLPYVFTEHGAIMAATILNTQRAKEISVFVVRAFVELRGLLGSQRQLLNRLDELEQRIEGKLKSHDESIAAILVAIRQLMASPERKPQPIGFTAPLRPKRE